MRAPPQHDRAGQGRAHLRNRCACLYYYYYYYYYFFFY
jgi:hypothetical protein